MIWWILLIWIIGFVVSYFVGDWETLFEKIWLSIFWPVIFPLYIIHYIHNK
jgi:hypothetical protein